MYLQTGRGAPSWHPSPRHPERGLHPSMPASTASPRSLPLGYQCLLSRRRRRHYHLPLSMSFSSFLMGSEVPNSPMVACLFGDLGLSKRCKVLLTVNEWRRGLYKEGIKGRSVTSL
jgi:hypothetical protein